VALTYFFDEIDTILADVAKPVFKTIKITYKTIKKLLDDKGNIVHEVVGGKVKYIDVVNNKSRVEEKTTSTMGDLQSTQENLQIFDGKKLYTINLSTKEGLYMDMPYAYEKPLYAWIDLRVSDKDNKYLVGSEEILGRKCSVYDFKDSKTWIWNGIILKEESRSEMSYNLSEATDIKENIGIDAHKFEVPSDIQIKSLEASSADENKKFNDILKAEKIVKKLEDAGIASMREAMSNPAAEEKLIDAVKNDKTLSDEEKQEALKYIREVLVGSREMLEKVRAKEEKAGVP
jgi:hypothetical protein